METPSRKKQYPRKKYEKENDSRCESPPANKKGSSDPELSYSPVYFPSTQETNEEIDVLWDWNSPQTSQRKKKKLKRLLPTQSPKFPIVRHASTTQSDNFIKLRNELKALQEELSIPDDESCLCVSPQQEVEFKRDGGNTNNQSEGYLDMFNDSVDEQLLLFSQQIENEIQDGKLINSSEGHNISNSSSSGIDHLINKYCDRDQDQCISGLKDDTFDEVLGTFILEESFANTPRSNSKNSLTRTLSEQQFSSRTNPQKQEFSRTRSFEIEITSTQNIGHISNTILQEIERKRLEALARQKKLSSMPNRIVEFHRTKSFEMATIQEGVSSKGKLLDEIERKRLEAKTRLEGKKKLDNTSILQFENIEKKRLEAIARREAKKIAEKNRQEALKKLRMKNAVCVKSTLVDKL